jgi:hypothetical protein
LPWHFRWLRVARVFRALCADLAFGTAVSEFSFDQAPPRGI